MFALFYDASLRKVRAINGSGRSPKVRQTLSHTLNPANLTSLLQALSLEKVRELGIEGDSFPTRDVNTATVPGAAAAWVDIHESFGSGKVTMEDILQPAIDLATKGFPVGPQAAAEVSLRPF